MEQTSKPIAVIFGAGSVGRGFMGQLFSESGYQVVFVDVDDALVEALNTANAYTLRLASLQKTDDLTISPVRAVNGRDTATVAAEVSQARILATAVGARALSAIAKPIAAGLVRRWQAEVTEPQNIVLCENLHDAPEQLRQFVWDELPHEQQDRLDERVGFVSAVIARMSPVPTDEQRAADPTLIVAEPYKVLPVDREAFVGQIPDIVGMWPVSPFIAYVERKLYIHNAGHAMLAYLGYRRGHAYGYEALLDTPIYQMLKEALTESSRALMAEHDLDAVALSENVQYLLDRFANRALGDPIDRLARDPLRKLAPGDRLVGAARLAEKTGIRPESMAWGIAAAIAYDNPDDPHAVDLQARLSEKGLKQVLREVCDISPDEDLAELVQDRYDHLLRDPMWQMR
jgi:mannitol-1-phosphate 5-dehydrogenase